MTRREVENALWAAIYERVRRTAAVNGGASNNDILNVTRQLFFDATVDLEWRLFSDGAAPVTKSSTELLLKAIQYLCD